MVEIIPAIMTESDEEFVRQIHILERLGVKRVHLDIADGFFTRLKTISGHEQLRRMNTDLTFDVHLMVQKPEQHCGKWCDIPLASRFLVHIETTTMVPHLHQQAVGMGKQLGVALNPDTSLHRIEPIVRDVDVVQFMGVHPGAQGRSFVSDVVDRVVEFHLRYPNIPLILDGGVTPTTIGGCVHAGATQIVSGSYIMRSADPARALRELQAAAAA